MNLIPGCWFFSLCEVYDHLRKISYSRSRFCEKFQVLIKLNLWNGSVKERKKMEEVLAVAVDREIREATSFPCI